MWEIDIMVFTLIESDTEAIDIIASLISYFIDKPKKIFDKPKKIFKKRNVLCRYTFASVSWLKFSLLWST